MDPRQRCAWITVGVSLLAWQAQAQAALLVAVEIEPGVACDAAEIRRAIAAELRTEAVAPVAAVDGAGSDALIVALDRSRIAMSFRAGPDRLVSRTVAAPADHAALLRTVAWLAGNLARDQASAFVVAEPPRAEPPGVVASRAAPALTTPAALAPARGASEPRWMITVAGGPTATPVIALEGSVAGLDGWFGVSYGTAWQLEVQRRATPESSILGAAIDVGSDGPGGVILGAAPFVGSSWGRGRWFLETTAGAGLEAVRKPVENPIVIASSTTGITAMTEQTLEIRPALYARVVGQLGVSISSSLDLLVRVGAHVSTAGRLSDFASSSVGMRFRLP